jgi:inner membrane protein
MMAITHAAIAAAGTSLIVGSANPLILALSITGSQLPDLDTSTSTIGQVLFPISSWIEDRFPHRSITHSFLATAFLAAVSFGICYYFSQPWKIALALPLGHLLSSFSDCFTKQGVQLFWPEKAWCISVSNPRRRLTTGGTGEYWVLTVAIALLIVSIQIAGSGGIQGQVTQSLGLRDGAIATYNQNAASQEIWADVVGVFASDRTTANGRYFVVDAVGNEFVLMDSTGNIYKTGTDILAEKVTTTTGKPQTTQLLTLTFNDEHPTQQLNQIPLGKLSFVSGQLTVDFPEDIPVEQSNVYQLSGSTIKFNYCSLEKVKELIREQYVIGTLNIKVIN